LIQIRKTGITGSNWRGLRYKSFPGLDNSYFVKLGSLHRHLRIYRLLNGTYRLPCLLYKYCKWPLQQKKKRKEEAYPWKAGASSGHTTNLKQSILRLSISMGICQNIYSTNSLLPKASF